MNNTKQFTIILLELFDGKIILQRRTDDAPYAPGKLGIFGGWVEEGETPDECIRREIGEETDLDINELNIALITDFTIPAGPDFAEDRQFFLYKTAVPHANFEVYEGKGAEAFTLDEIKKRNDLTGSALYAFEKVL